MRTAICVWGRGKPARINNKRSQVSLGDWAPPSTRSRAALAAFMPRRPR
ncbi:Uncharacterised protein [Mycobacterium tuberculosis]|nr:Uncharacterised protein [Mycobacterium tuberculosis]